MAKKLTNVPRMSGLPYMRRTDGEFLCRGGDESSLAIKTPPPTPMMSATTSMASPRRVAVRACNNSMTGASTRSATMTRFGNAGHPRRPRSAKLAKAITWFALSQPDVGSPGRSLSARKRTASAHAANAIRKGTREKRKCDLTCQASGIRLQQRRQPERSREGTRRTLRLDAS